VNSAVAYFVRGELDPTYQYQEYCESALDRYSSRISALTSQPIETGNFKGCFGRTIGEPAVAISLHMTAEESEEDDMILASIACWETPGKRSFFSSYKVTQATTENLSIIVDALKVAIAEDPDAVDPTWMTLKDWCSAEATERLTSRG